MKVKIADFIPDVNRNFEFKAFIFKIYGFQIFKLI